MQQFSHESSESQMDRLFGRHGRPRRDSLDSLDSVEFPLQIVQPYISSPQSAQSAQSVNNTIDWRAAYCNYYHIVMDAAANFEDPAQLQAYIEKHQPKTNTVNFYFNIYDAGGGGDCFFHSILKCHELYGTTKRLDKILETCILDQNPDQISCVREFVYNQSARHIPAYPEVARQRIRVKGTFIEDDDIAIVATTLNIRVLMYTQAAQRWRLFEPAILHRGTAVPTYYVINIGGIHDGVAGFHYQCLQKQRPGNFSC